MTRNGNTTPFPKELSTPPIWSSHTSLGSWGSSRRTNGSPTFGRLAARLPARLDPVRHQIGSESGSRSARVGRVAWIGSTRGHHGTHLQPNHNSTNGVTRTMAATNGNGNASTATELANRWATD